MAENETTEVEKPARLVRLILLSVIWLTVIAMVGAFVIGFFSGYVRT